MTFESKNYSAIDIANYVISKSVDPTINDKVTNLKLQKILYFLQAAFLVEKQVSLIKESFQPWAYGPVIPQAYRFFNQFGYNRIEETVSEFDIDTTNGFEFTEIKFNPSKISVKDRDLIDSYYQQISKYSAGELVDLTHSQQFWINAEKSGEIARRDSNPYTDDDILDAFKDNRFKIWEKE